MMDQTPKRERRMSLAVETKNSVMRRLSLLLPKGAVPDIKKEKENLLAEITAESRVFGVELKTAVMRSNKLHYLLPAVVYKCLVYLEQKGINEEGIFRLTGSVADMKKMKEQFDQGSDCNVTQCSNPHTVAGLLKLFIRELPTPLLPTELEDGETNLIGGVQAIIDKLPQETRCLLSCLFKLLSKVSQQEAVTKMGITNLVIVFSPALQCSGTIVTTLIKHSSTIFPENLLDITSNTVVFGVKIDDVNNNANSVNNSPQVNDRLIVSTSISKTDSKKDIKDEDIFIVDTSNPDMIKIDKINNDDIDALIIATKSKSESGGKQSLTSKSTKKSSTPTGSKNNTPIMSRWRKKSSLFEDDE